MKDIVQISWEEAKRINQICDELYLIFSEDDDE